MDAGGNSIEVSAQGVRGIATQGVRNLGWLQALHPEDLDTTMSVMKDALRTGKTIDIEYRISVDGEWKWRRSRGWARHGPTGEILRWYGTVEDIDER
jgi:PAS domain S-box-containing protein